MGPTQKDEVTTKNNVKQQHNSCQDEISKNCISNNELKTDLERTNTTCPDKPTSSKIKKNCSNNITPNKELRVKKKQQNLKKKK